MSVGIPASDQGSRDIIALRGGLTRINEKYTQVMWWIVMLERFLTSVIKCKQYRVEHGVSSFNLSTIVL